MESKLPLSQSKLGKIEKNYIEFLCRSLIVIRNRVIDIFQLVPKVLKFSRGIYFLLDGLIAGKDIRALKANIT
jgi:hypothetical protein|tara:strand:- start:441 stop:659 length:219 start_codon:yes stop_codon:yes gene_type:complete